MLANGVERLADMQERLYAENRSSLLAVFQAMDAAGKDGAIKHVMSGINPQGCQVHAFKAPSAEELDHDFLWRVAKVAAGARPHRHLQPLVLRGSAGGARASGIAGEAAPAEGRHQGHLGPALQVDPRVRAASCRQRNAVLKFFLHVSKDEQRKRFLARLDEPAKRWKFSMGDIAERELWDKYQHAYEEAIRHTSRPETPWYVVPADNKWFARIVIAGAMVEALEKLDPQYPKVEGKALKELETVRKALRAESHKGD